MFDPSTLNWKSIVNKFAICIMNSANQYRFLSIDYYGLDRTIHFWINGTSWYFIMYKLRNMLNYIFLQNKTNKKSFSIRAFATIPKASSEKRSLETGLTTPAPTPTPLVTHLSIRWVFLEPLHAVTSSQHNLYLC